MLLSFRFANHRSFRDEQQLNLLPVYDSDGSPDADDIATRVVGIFGANASGKSNCLHALMFARQFALNSDRAVEPGLDIVTAPFRLDHHSPDEPSRYVVDLRLSGVRYTYGFALTRTAVVEEWLYFYPRNRQAKVFERDGSQFTFGTQIGRKVILEQVAGITAPTALFLSTAARFNIGAPGNPLISSVYEWFSRIRDLSGPRPPLTSVATATDDWDHNVIVGLLRAADVGIVEMIVKAAPTPPTVKIQLSHRSAADPVLFDLADESTGTRQLLNLATDASTILRSGGTMTVDEIDASLHPMLTAQLIRLFQNPSTNPKHSQLLFTSHDAALLGTLDGAEVLRRDQIWFTEKDHTGASVLYPLAEFKPRKSGENRQRRYLNGNYGAIPELSYGIFEQAVAGRLTADA